MIWIKISKSILFDQFIFISTLVDYSILTKFDPQGMHKVLYDRWPEIAKQSFESDLAPVNFDKIDHIVFAGIRVNLAFQWEQMIFLPVLWKGGSAVVVGPKNEEDAISLYKDLLGNMALAKS